jgi:hypothetical protein
LYFTSDFLPITNPKLKVIEGDIRDVQSFTKSVFGHDAVINLACISNDASFELDEELSTSVNFNAFEPMVKAAKKAGVKRFIYASSSSVYGVSDQPNVTEAKEQTSALLNEWKGVLPAFSGDTEIGALEIFGQGANATEALSQLISQIPADGYIAVMAYLDRKDDDAIVELREILASKSNRPVTFGWGPRFLHSTGQFHKGGQQNGVFLQITGDVKKDIAIPGQSYGFKTLVAAQALGDGKALASRKYPLLRFNLTNRAMGISELLKAAKAL